MDSGKYTCTCFDLAGMCQDRNWKPLIETIIPTQINTLPLMSTPWCVYMSRPSRMWSLSYACGGIHVVEWAAGYQYLILWFSGLILCGNASWNMLEFVVASNEFEIILFGGQDAHILGGPIVSWAKVTHSKRKSYDIRGCCCCSHDTLYGSSTISYR